MTRSWKSGVVGGVALLCGAAQAAIIVDGYGSCSVKANSTQNPYSESHAYPGWLYLSEHGMAEVSGARASSWVATESTPQPGREHEWPLTCKTFTGAGEAKASIWEPNGLSAAAVSHVAMSFDVDALTGVTTFNTTGVGRITLFGPGNQLLVDCHGDRTIFAYLSPGHYELDAAVSAEAKDPTLSQAGTFDFEVPEPGVLSVVWLAALRRRR